MVSLRAGNTPSLNVGLLPYVGLEMIKLSIIVFVTLLFAAACNKTSTTEKSQINTRSSPTTAHSTRDEFASARDIFRNICARCHRANAEGGTFELEGVTMKVPSLKGEHARQLTDEQIAQQIANGGRGMPSFKSRLKPDQINEMVRFIRQELQEGAVAK